MRRRVMMVLASAALAGSLLATDAQARGGGGHVGGGGGGHMGGFGGAHIGAHVGGFGGARMEGIGESRISGFGGARIRGFGGGSEVTLAMERAFAEVALQFQQRLRLGKLRYPAVTTVLMHPRPHLAQSQIRR